MKFRLPGTLHNWLSVTGFAVAAITFLTIIALVFITMLVGGGDFYLGMFMYIILPGIMVAGLIMIPIGMMLEARRERLHKDEPVPGWPRIDLNDPKQRKAFTIFALGSAVYILISAVGSYEAYHITESIQFCGLLCHTVMEPQYTLYKSSDHAKVPCAECHVGPGASWFVKSKLSGSTQIINTVRQNYPRPLPTPIKNLRPARDVCEQCHWPQKFYAYKLVYDHKYLSDEANTQWDLQLVMKIGSEHPPYGLKEGIHWHINPDMVIEYAASDKRLQKIPWVRFTNKKTGETTDYFEDGKRVDEGDLQTMSKRTMDCMDCHNKPAHEFVSPARFITEAMTGGEIPLNLPNIKTIAMVACTPEYPSNDAAMSGISEKIHAYYEKNYPQIYREKDELIQRAVKGVQAAFSRNIFPFMKARWSYYPNNIGHREFNGCFRCHDGKHKSEKGDVIRKDCNLCHLITAQGKPESLQTAPSHGEPLEFNHPVEVGTAWRDGLCTDCHTGLNP